MTTTTARRALAGSVAFVALAFAAPTLLAQDATVEGVFALPGAEQAVTGQLDVTETGPLTRQVELTFAHQDSGEQITGFDVELTQQLHILATNAGLTHLIHEHADVVGDDGRFTAEIEFPAPGLYHIYMDVVPTGLGQQVLRFDVTVGEDAAAGQPAMPSGQDVSIGPLVSSDGPYSVTMDAAHLRPGAESLVSLLVERDGAPASDLEPYLGVAAHAVFIRAEDLAYVHAHAMEAGEGQGHGGHGAHGGHAAPAPAPAAAEAGGHDHGAESATGGHDHGAPPAQEAGHGAHDTTTHEGDHGAHGAAPAASISPDMSLHVTPPAAGTYAVWIEFIGGGEVRTVPFAIDIPEAGSHASH